MVNQFTINLDKPIESAKILDGYGVPPDCTMSQNAQYGSEAESSAETQKNKLLEDLDKQKAEFAQLCQTLNNLISEINRFYEEVLARHKEEIAKLSVEIANKILMQKVQKGDYEIESIIKEALKNAPARQDIVVHLNPEDLSQYQSQRASGQQDDAGNTLAGVKFVADPGIGRAECLLETPKGIVKSFVNEHLEQISEALKKVE